ncbi:MAG: class C beta-lactamase [Rhodoferax sp.]|uniref:class C beta-lactamase n=1 Tax=Rhodoferax sp. TaxID=50421 RepID=UPI003267633E
MKNWDRRFLTGAMLALGLGLTLASHAAEISRAQAQRVTSEAVKPAMEKNQIPGLAIGLVVGEQTFVFNYGLASVKDQQHVADSTIFEIGSISKTFTASLASYAEVHGNLKLSDTVDTYLPELKDTDFGRLQLFHLGTHTTGGLPLQVPDSVENEAQLMGYFRAWKPPYKTGEVRTYANPSIGTLGLVAAKSLHQSFTIALGNAIFRPLGLNSTYIHVPAQKIGSYAFGYNKQNLPVRVNPGVLADEAYGVKTTATDLIRFLKANMGMLTIDGKLQTALDRTRQGYFQVGDMTQDLIWEEYALPVELQVLQKGNSAALIYRPTPVVALVPPANPGKNAWVNKTGSTNGFGAYVAFVPAKRFGIVVLANKNYPNEERVALAHKIFEELSR